MTLVLTCPNGQPNQIYQLQTANDDLVPALTLQTDLNSCTAVNGTSTAAILAALATGAAEVCFPPAVYDVTALVAQSVPGQVLNFQVGAVLRFAASGLGKLQLNGDGASIIGQPVARWDAASAVAYTAIDIHGIGATSVGWRFEANANITNATCLQLSGDYTEVGPCVATGVGEIGTIINQAHTDDTEVAFPIVGRLKWLPVDDGITTRTFGTLIRYKGHNGKMGGIECNTGGRSILGQAFDLVGHLWQIDNPQVFCTQADWGMRIRDGAEFGEVWGGEFHQSSDGNARAGSQGIELGEGSVALYGTKFIGWDFGCRFTGACDACGFFKAVFANNKTANLEIDTTPGGGTPVPVSGCGLYSCYFECEAVVTCQNIHLKTGAALGMVIAGGQQAWGAVSPTPAADVSILGEPGFSGTDCWITGTRFQGSNATDAFTQPGNATTKFLFGPFAAFATNNLSKGAFADQAVSVRDPVLQGVVVGTRDTSTANNHFIKIITDIFTANFGNVAAGASVDLNFNYAAVPAVATASLVATFDAALRAKATAGIVFTWAIDSSGHIGGTAFNPTAATINAVSGGVRFLIFATG